MAQAILLKDVESLGERGQAIDVAPGYLRNYLIPRKLAQPATPGARGSAAAPGGSPKGRGGASQTRSRGG